MITSEELLKNGYKKYKDLLYKADNLYQKAIYNDSGIKYFINFYEYDKGFEVKLQFEFDEYDMNLCMFAIDENMSIEDIEKKVYAIWYGLDAKYYERWEKNYD